jgi:olefin beta-lactone synthetase
MLSAERRSVRWIAMKPAETTNNDLANVSSFLKQVAKIFPDKPAAVCYAGCNQNSPAQLTFRQLDRESDRLAYGLEKSGIKRGTRTILMVKPSLEFFILIFALFKIGAVPVVVDPGMGVRRMLDCLNESDPEAFIGIPLAHVLRTLFSTFFKSVHIWITVGRRWFWGGRTFKHLAKEPERPYTIAKTRKDDMAAILFTTGSTGPAKGVVYTHGNFVAQLQQIKTHLKLSSDEVDLSTFPLFALFWPALGITSVIPEMDPTKPARVDPEKIIAPIREQGVTSMFASPALLNRVGRYGKTRGIKLPSLKRVISAGAPVSSSNIEQFASMLSENAEVHTPYGATEAVPIISIGSHEILSETDN